ncbi:MAG TPA: serine/threonine-protein kinase [Tepidisphaeraceae bacterium]|jgi:hypothetical protein
MTLDETVATRGFQYKHGDRPLEGYTIQRAAGRGGFGEVYYAISDSGREVALKLVHTYEQIELRGISQCMNLKSPHLVTIFDVKYGDDGRPWVIMEYVNGPSLRELLDAAPSGLGAAKSAFFLREIGKGLTYLHDCGIVHRDLKPGNIFYENGYVKIGDYGLSKTMSVTRHSGQTVAVGTLHYMAPEIGEGCYDCRIDIYALGALLFEMLTGQVPFFGSSPAEVLMKHLTSEVNLDAVEEPFRSTIRKAMAKNPADRFQRVQDMVDAVFGSEQIRSSVSQVSAESLSTVAGRVAPKIGSGAAAGFPPRPPQDRWEEMADRVTDRFTKFGDRIKNVGDRIADRVNQGRWNQNSPFPAAGAEGATAKNDSVTKPVRILLAFMAAFLAAFLAMANTDSRHGAQAMVMVWVAICGAWIGAGVSRRWILPGIVGESAWIKRLALGAPIAIGASVLSFPVWVSSQSRSFYLPSAMEASFLGLLLLCWDERLLPNREERFSIGHLFTSGILALALAGMFNADQGIVIGIVAGASLAVSLCVPWNQRMKIAPFSGAAGRPGVVPGAPAVNRPDAPPPPVSPPPIPPVEAPPIFSNSPTYQRRRPRPATGFGIALCVLVMVMLFAHDGARLRMLPIFLSCLIMFLIFLRRGGLMASSYSPAAYHVPQDSSITVGGLASGFARFILSLVGSVLLLVSLLLVVAMVSDLPGLFASGALNQAMPGEFARTFGTDNWPQLLSEIGQVTSFVIGAAAIVLISLARRSRGGLHIVRAIVGILILFVAAVAIGHALPDWAYFIPSKMAGANVDWIFKHVYTHRTFGAALIGAAGYTILLWPARRQFLQAPAVNPGRPSSS